MDENNLKQLWLNSCSEQRIEINPAKLIESLNQKLLYIEKQIRRRDGTEIFIALLIIPLFGWWFFVAPYILAKIGAAIIVVNCVLVIIRLNRARKVEIKEEHTSTIRNNLMVSLQLVRQQMKLSDTIL